MTPLVKKLLQFVGTMVLLGVLMMIIAKIPLFDEFPSDIHIELGNFQVNVPITASLVVSALLSGVIWAVSYLGKKL